MRDLAVCTVSARVVLMAKVPVPGTVKTRLIPALGADGAAHLHVAMVDATLDLVAASGLPCSAALMGPMDHPFVLRLRSRGIEVQRQEGPDLGGRLEHALSGTERALAIGADCVTFSPDWLLEAAEASTPVAVGPAEDGGYWVIAVSGSVAREAVFRGIPWSTDQVLTQTLAQAKAAGLAVHQVPGCYDVDRPADLERLQTDPRCPPGVLELLAQRRR